MKKVLYFAERFKVFTVSEGPAKAAFHTAASEDVAKDSV